MSITRVPTAHRSPVFGLATAREADDRWRIFTVGRDRRVRAWDAATGAQDDFTAPAPGPTLQSLVAAGDLLVWSTVDRVQRLDRRSGAPVGPAIRTSPANRIAVTTAAEVPLIVVADRRGLLTRWDLRTGEPFGEPLAGHKGAVTAVGTITLPGGRVVIVSGGADFTVRRWDALTGEPLGPPMQGHKASVADVCCADEPALIATQTTAGSIRLWDAATGESIGDKINQRADHGWAGGLALTPDGRVLFSVNRLRVLSRWDLTAAAWVPQPLSAPVATVSRVAMAGTVLVSATEQGVIRRWAPTGAEIGPPLTGHPTSVSPIAAVPAAHGGRAVVVSAASDGARYWNAVTGDQIGDPTADPLPFQDGLAGVWLGDGRLIVASYVEGALSRHDVLAGTASAAPLPGEPGVAALAAVPLPDGSGLIAAMTTDGEIMRIDAATGRLTGSTLDGHGDEGYEVAATTLPDGTVMLAGVGDDNRILRWDARTGEAIGAPLDTPGPVMSLTFRTLPSGPVLLLSMADGGEVRRWEAATGKPVGDPLQADEEPSVPLDPARVDPSRLTAVSGSEWTRCWDATSGHHLGDVDGAISSALLALPDGRTALATGHEDGSLEILRLP
jgi:WD40 repeat protein